MPDGGDALAVLGVAFLTAVVGPVAHAMVTRGRVEPDQEEPSDGIVGEALRMAGRMEARVQRIEQQQEVTRELLALWVEYAQERYAEMKAAGLTPPRPPTKETA